MVDIITFSLLCARCHAVEKMTRNSNTLQRDGSVMADSDLVDKEDSCPEGMVAVQVSCSCIVILKQHYF